MGLSGAAGWLSGLPGGDGVSGSVLVKDTVAAEVPEVPLRLLGFARSYISTSCVLQAPPLHILKLRPSRY